MWQTLGRLWRAKELRKRILITLLFLAVYRIGAVIPVPGVNASLLQSIAGKSPLVGVLNTFSGGALSNFSIFSMSIYPYVTASIVVQMLQMGVIKQWEDWSKEGETGQIKLNQWTRYLTIALGLFQSVAMTISFSREIGAGFIVDPSIWTYAVIAITMTAGTTLLMWMGEQITDKGVGNGISVIIFLSILSRVEVIVPQIYSNWFYAHPDQLFLNIIKVILLLVALLVITMFVIFFQQAVRRIPVQFTRQQIGLKVYGGQNTHIPLKVNAAGVIPMIFATSVLFVPTIVSQFFRNNKVAEWFLNYFSPTSNWFVGIEAILIIAFTFFYTFIQINPQQMAENLQKGSGYIPGIRPGKETEKYVTKLINRISLIGGLFLAVLTVIPSFVSAFTGLTGILYYFAGTSILIIVSVTLDTVVKQLQGQILQRSYKGFIR